MKKEAPGSRYENALPVKKGKGSRKGTAKDENTARRRRRDN